jgi:predicted double-glycine peptidase
MNLVTQEVVDGCGVACYAMMTGKTYREALEDLHPGAQPIESHETSNEDLMRAIQRAGFDIEICIRPNIRNLRDSILVVRYPIENSMYMHTVVWSAEDQRVLDPFEDRPFEEYEKGICLAFELSRISGPSGDASPAGAV